MFFKLIQPGPPHLLKTANSFSHFAGPLTIEALELSGHCADQTGPRVVGQLADAEVVEAKFDRQAGSGGIDLARVFFNVVFR